MTTKQVLTQATKDLAAAGITSARLDTELLVARVLGRDRAWVLAHDDTELDEPQLEQMHNLITRRANREPLVHLTGVREFYGLDFEITPDVLTPRVETEQMVEWAINYAPESSSLIDIGTGCGAIAIAIKKHRPDLSVSATDISERELVVAQRNATKHHTDITFIKSDLWQAIDGIYNTVTGNLPYLADNAGLMPEVTKEPAVALFGGPDGLGLYRHFLRELPHHLGPGGFLFTESDPWQHEALITEAATHNLKPIEQGYFILGFQLHRAAS